MSEILSGGRYTVLRRLAAGGMGEVLLADFPGDATLGLGTGIVVIKRVLPTSDNRAHHGAMLREEGRLGVRLLHANVVETFFIDEHDGDPLLVMEYLSGRALSQVLGQAKKRKERIPLGVTLKVLRGAACGLHFAHTLRDQGRPLGLVHRDVSPANIFVTFDGRVKVIDFGVAKADDSEIKTSTGILKGKLGYMSPEQALGTKLTPASDMWALGVLFWEMLCAERLFGAASPAVTLAAICDTPAPSPRMHRPDLPQHIEALCMRLLERRLEDRICTGRDLVDALDRLPEISQIQDADIGDWLSGNFPNEAEVGRSEAARAARSVRSAPTPEGLVEGNAVSGPGGDDMPTIEWTAQLQDNVLEALENAFEHATDPSAEIPMLEEIAGRRGTLDLFDDVEIPPTDPLAGATVTDPLTWTESNDDDSAMPGRVVLGPRRPRTPVPPSPPMPASLQPPAFHPAPAFLPSPSPESAAMRAAPHLAPQPPHLPTTSSGSFTAPTELSPLGPEVFDLAPEAMVDAEVPLWMSTVRIGGREASWLSVSGLAFGTIALSVGLIFAVFTAHPVRAPLVAVEDPTGTQDVLYAATDAPPTARLVDMDNATVKVAGITRSMTRAELMPHLERSGVWQRMTLPTTGRAKLAALLPVLIAALGSMSLAFAVPAIFDSDKKRRTLVQATLAGILGVACVLAIDGGALSWPGLEAWRAPASLVLDASMISGP